MGEWQPFKTNTTRPGPCVHCGRQSSWHPTGWYFRYASVKGAGLHGPKIRYERSCGACVAPAEPAHVD